MKKDYYKILNIDKKATLDDIKKSYRKLSLQYHPDKNSDPSAKDIYLDIKEAYETLSDTDKRKNYDNPPIQDNFTPFGNWGNMRPKPPVRNIEISCTISDIYFSKKIKFSYTRHKMGDGGKKMCTKCYGKRFTSSGTNQMGHTYIEMCDECMGVGYSVDYITETKSLEVTAALGSSFIEGAGNQQENGVYEDLRIIMNVVESNDGITLVSNTGDLLISKKILLIDYLMGCDVTVNHFDGDYKMKHIYDGKITKKYRIKGKGINKKDLYVDINPLLPKNISESDKELLKKLSESPNFSEQYQTP